LRLTDEPDEIIEVIEKRCKEIELSPHLGQVETLIIGYLLCYKDLNLQIQRPS
jgi:hypothetical protein